MSHIQERMKKLGIKQVDLILELRKRGITVQPPEMSSIIRGVYTYPKATVVLLYHHSRSHAEVRGGVTQCRTRWSLKIVL